MTNMLPEIAITCPYCGETFYTVVDCSGGSQEYIEDCQVCCRPIIFNVGEAYGDEPPQVWVKTEND